jgi:uncharacterized protein
VPVRGLAKKIGTILVTAAAPLWANRDELYRLEVDGQTRTTLWVARRRAERRQGLLGTDRLDGALWIERCSSVHTIGMRYPIDVAFVGATGQVRDVVTMAPGRVGLPRPLARAVVEAPAGVLRELGVRRGTVLAAR